MTGGRSATAVVAVLLGLGLLGCGGTSRTRVAVTTSTATSTAPAVSPRIEYARMQSADCALWKVLDRHAQDQLLADFHRFFGARVDAAASGGLRGPTLTDAQARRQFATYCKLPFATYFKLYKLYGRAAAFAPAS